MTLPTLLTPAQFAAIFGVKPRTVYAWMRARRVEVIRLSRPRIPESEVERLMQAYRVPAKISPMPMAAVGAKTTGKGVA